MTGLKKNDVLGVIVWVSQAWDEIPSLTLVQSQKILPDYTIDSGYEAAWNENENTELSNFLKQVPGLDENVNSVEQMLKNGW